MKIHSLKIKGLRRISETEIKFGDATFLIGPNNTGKSTILLAIEFLLSASKRIDDKDYYSIIDEETQEQKTTTNEIVLEAEFRNLPIEAKEWKGFKGRIFTYEPTEENETGLCIFYRKTYTLGKDVVVEMKSKKRHLLEKYSQCKSPKDYIDLGIDEKTMVELFTDTSKKITSKDANLLESVDEIWEFEEEEDWFSNPGGIQGVVLNKLPKFLLIPADSAANHLESDNGVLGKTLSELFEEVRGNSKNYIEAQKYLDELAKELDPKDSESEFGKMIIEINEILKSVFPESKLHADTDLSDPNKVLKPKFLVELSSNIRTSVTRQGAGMIRAAAFGILRYRQNWISKKDSGEARSLIVAFEEPELYLHPSAANQMRNTLYGLSSSNSQIVATTHSPYMIDLSRKPRQVLNRQYVSEGDVKTQPFSVSDAFKKLQNEDKDYVKLLLKIDDYIARIFFTNNVVVVEELVLKESIARLDEEKRNLVTSNYEIVKARGKASIIGLLKYLSTMGISPYVIHDRDKGVPKAEIFNSPIEKLVEDKNKLHVLEECIEDVLGYTAPSGEKPYKAFKYLNGLGETWDDLPKDLIDLMKKIFKEI